MRKFTMDNVAIRPPNASHLGFNKWVLKRGDVFTANGHICRSLGRIKWCDSDGVDCRGHVVALMLCGSGEHAAIRWIDPKDVVQVIDCPSKFAAFFFSKQLLFSANDVVRLAEYGALSEQFIDHAPDRVLEWGATYSETTLS